MVDLSGNRLELSGTSHFLSNGALYANILTMGVVFNVCDDTDFSGLDQDTITTLTVSGTANLEGHHVINARAVTISGDLTVDSLDIGSGWDSLTLSGSGSSFEFTPASMFPITTTTVEGTMTSNAAMAEGA